jgi:hypothetical protein
VEVIIEVNDKKSAAFLDFIKTIPYIKVRDTATKSKLKNGHIKQVKSKNGVMSESTIDDDDKPTTLSEDLIEAFNEIRLHQEDKIELKTLEQVLDEL